MKLNKTHQRETNYAAKISRNVLLNFCAIYQMQTADNATTFKIWFDDEIRHVCATNGFISA